MVHRGRGAELGIREQVRRAVLRQHGVTEVFDQHRTGHQGRQRGGDPLHTATTQRHRQQLLMDLLGLGQQVGLPAQRVVERLQLLDQSRRGQGDGRVVGQQGEALDLVVAESCTPAW